MDEKTFQYMKDRTRLFEAKSNCIDKIAKILNALAGGACLTVQNNDLLQYLSGERRKEFLGTLAWMIAYEIEIIEKEREEI